MRKLTIQEALASARETRALEIGKNILAKTPDVFRQQFQGRKAVVVADKNTFAIAGQTIVSAFEAARLPILTPFIFDDPNLYAEFSFVEQLEASLKTHDAVPIAVGSGVINDLVKLAAHRTGRPYMCVATAASMDGYTAFGASITYKGSKQTFNCPAPQAVLADIEIIRHAPAEMTASGYADMLAKVTAGADWILADALGAEPIHEQAWQIVQGGLRDAVNDPAGVREGNEKAIFKLTESLMLGGFGMQAAKSSRPASGAEHQFSHLWDMQHHTHNGAAPSHGFKVGIGTLAVIALYEHLLSQPLQALNVDRCCANWPDEQTFEKQIQKLFAKDDFADKAVEEMRAKYLDSAALREQLELLKSKWPQLQRQLREQLIRFGDLKGMLEAAGAPVEPEQIGISRRRLRDSFLQAYFIRRRFTVLDLAVRAGLLESSLIVLFGLAGVWPIEVKELKTLRTIGATS